jgi:hypothetical protein
MNQLPPRIRALLIEHHTLVLATVGSDGAPEAASIFYAPVDDSGVPALVCALLISSTKLAHLRVNPRAGVYIGPQRPTRWLQGAVVARIVDAPDERERRLAQLLAHAPDAGIFVERVPVTPVVLSIRSLKMTDLTGGQPPVEMVEVGAPETNVHQVFPMRD